MKKIFLFAIGLISLTLYSQHEKEIKYLNYKWKTTSEKRAIYIREIVKQNDTLFSVTDFHKNGKVSMKGQYSSIKPMIENGFFEFYDFENYLKISTGHYSNGEMSGDWTFFTNGEISKQINYDLKLIYNNSMMEDKPDSNSIVIVVEQMPKFQDSDNLADFARYVKDNLFYPPMAARYLIEGRVFVLFTIDRKGNVSDIEVKNKVHKDLEREAIRVISQSPDWTPGYQKGKPVRVNFTFPINFDLTK